MHDEISSSNYTVYSLAKYYWSYLKEKAIEAVSMYALAELNINSKTWHFQV